MNTTLINAGSDVLKRDQFSKAIYSRIYYRFTLKLIGIISTTIHIAVVCLLLTGSSIDPIVVNAVAFLTAFGISFAEN